MAFMPYPYPELEKKLRPLAQILPLPRPGDWLAEHDEPGQTFAEYLDAQPVRKSGDLHTIYLCLVGEFTETQQHIPRHRNPPDGDGGPNHWEIWLRDLDGYKVVLASPDGTADGNWRPG
jgi:hypothetical protein